MQKRGCANTFTESLLTLSPGYYGINFTKPLVRQFLCSDTRTFIDFNTPRNSSCQPKKGKAVQLVADPLSNNEENVVRTQNIIAIGTNAENLN